MGSFIKKLPLKVIKTLNWKYILYKLNKNVRKLVVKNFKPVILVKKIEIPQLTSAIANAKGEILITIKDNYNEILYLLENDKLKFILSLGERKRAIAFSNDRKLLVYSMGSYDIIDLNEKNNLVRTNIISSNLQNAEKILFEGKNIYYYIRIGYYDHRIVKYEIDSENEIILYRIEPSRFYLSKDESRLIFSVPISDIRYYIYYYYLKNNMIREDDDRSIHSYRMDFLKGRIYYSKKSQIIYTSYNKKKNIILDESKSFYLYKHNNELIIIIIDPKIRKFKVTNRLVRI